MFYLLTKSLCNQQSYNCNVKQNNIMANIYFTQKSNLLIVYFSDSEALHF